MPRTIFVTATDTGAGKTWITSGLVQHWLAAGLDAQALKPLASGRLASGINEDVLALLEAQQKTKADAICYQTYQQPLAPALAAKLEQKPLHKEHFLTWVKAQASKANVTLIEGVGGLMVPLIADSAGSWLVSDWLAEMPDADVMLVVPLRLGCMNHALLSCALLAQMKRVPKWIVLNDLENNKTGEATKATLLPSLSLMFGSVPEVPIITHLNDLKSIKITS